MGISSVSGSSDDPPYLRAGNAEREANNRIIAANKTVQTEEREAEDRLKVVRDSFEKQEETISARAEKAMESQKFKGYEEIRDLQRAQQADMGKRRRDGDHELQKTSDYYRDSVSRTNRQGMEQLSQLENEDFHKLEHIRKGTEAEVDDLKAQHGIRLEQTHQTAEEQLNHMTEVNQKQFENMRRGYQDSKAHTQEIYTNELQNTTLTNEETLQRIQEKASQELKNIRLDTAQKLSAYSTRQSDPFYKLMNIHGKLKEESDSFILTARIPEYEQQHVSVSIKGDNIIISGHRKNEEGLEFEPGHQVGSSSYQSFHETFALPWPVDASRLTKEFDGDEVTVRVPKKNEFAFHTPPQPQPKKLRVEAPQFPENIPHPKKTARLDQSNGSGTLT